MGVKPSSGTYQPCDESPRQGGSPLGLWGLGGTEAERTQQGRRAGPWQARPPCSQRAAGSLGRLSRDLGSAPCLHFLDQMMELQLLPGQMGYRETRWGGLAGSIQQRVAKRPFVLTLHHVCSLPQVSRGGPGKERREGEKGGLVPIKLFICVLVQ